MEVTVELNAGEKLFVIYLYQWDHGEDQKGIVCDCNIITLSRKKTFNRVEQFRKDRVEGDVDEVLVRMRAI